ncbi:family 20 glycosylhydrolase [Streptomyces sp. NBC_00841]|uniref:family 20 glycosylhydrolase n=1 Tax=Streptomyces sp. NBC_00841 TaxID=2975847 RepID=UPI002DDBD64C|nr:family 20 glycosylhydrolase [Streptomyces sp. NBC_00841]WRZ97087.1 family 20 glycosylhydrolase [Streptomyces sp. NBC_00841]
MKGLTRQTRRPRRTTLTLTALAVGALLLPLVATSPSMAAAPGPQDPAPRTRAVNPAPAVLPSLQEWQGGRGHWRLTGSSRILVSRAEAAELTETARTFAADLSALLGRTIPVASGSARPGDVVLTAHTDDPGLDTEGYRLTSAAALTIEAPTPTGVFYGTQTVQQILKADPRRARVPKGTARDWPRMGQRAQMLDVGRKFYPVSYLKSQIRLMAWQKLNTFHLHLTDWRGFRIRTEKFPELAAKESYSAADLRELQDYARRYHVEIIPEVDLPGHATPITAYDPRLRFSCPSMDKAQWPGGEQGGWTLDITKEHTRRFVHDLLEEIIPMFDSRYFHVGGDEIGYDNAKNACPELVAYQKERGFEHPGDVFVDFLNTLNRQVRSHGKTTEAWEWWNVYGQKSSIAPDKNIVIDTWVSDDPSALADQGYRVVATPEQRLYVSPGFGRKPDTYGYVDVRAVYEDYTFPTPDNVSGYKVARWSDKAEEQSPEWFDFFARRPLQVLAERAWGGPRSATVWEFFARADAIGGPSPDEPTALPKSGMRVTSVDSEETVAEKAAAANVLDDDPYTHWHTAYSPAPAAPPHEITVDTGGHHRLSGFRYLPRQDGGANGRVRDYEFSVSDNGRTWRTVATGSFADDQTEKEVTFKTTAARHIRFRALSATNDGPFTSMAELTVLQVPALPGGHRTP